MKARFPYALPFALLASLAACSSSSGGGETTDGGTKDTGTGTKHDTGTGTPDTGTTKMDAGKKDTGVTFPDTGVDSSGGGITVTPAPGSKQIAAGFIQVIGITDDDYIVYYDAQQGVSVSDINGTVQQLVPGPTDGGGVGPEVVGLGGNIVAVLTDYTTKSVMGTVEPVAGTLSIWSHTKTGGMLKQIATDAGGIISVAADSSYVAYTDGVDSSGNIGNIGVVAGDGTGATDLAMATNVTVDETSTTCPPYVLFDGHVAIVSDCSLADGSTGSNSITAYDGSNSWAATVLAASAGTNNFSAFPGAINLTADTSGNNALTVTPAAGGNLNVIPLAGGTATSLSSMFGAPSGGVPFFYLAPDSSFALFTNVDGSYSQSTFATPASAPVTTTLVAATSGVFGVQVISSDQKYEVDYNTALDTSTEAPTSLNLRRLSDGMGFPLVPSGTAIASTFGGVNGFTTDNSYVIFTANLKVAGPQSSTGTLAVAPVATGTPVTLVSNQTVWDAAPLTGTKIIYNQNYITSMFIAAPTGANGGAFGDVYITDATNTAANGTGTLFITQADAADGFYITKDKSHLFYSFTQFALGDGGTGVVVNGDGLYAVALP